MSLPVSRGISQRRVSIQMETAGGLTSVYVIRAFVKMREEVAANAAILRRLAEIDKTLLVHDVTLREILQKLRPLLEPPPQPPKPEIGFHVKEDAVRYRVRKKN
jgi:hypothetical protein